MSAIRERGPRVEDAAPENRYMVREERFITDQEAQEFNFKAG